jgi:phospholipase/carboxylesterase
VKIQPQQIETGQAIESSGLIHRVLIPDSSGTHPTVVMIHGHLGNEDVMWVFARTLPSDWLVVAPRAIIPISGQSFTWQRREENEWPSLDQFAEAVTAVTKFIHALPELYGADLKQIYLMGFSQGAAVSFATAIHRLGWIKGIASLVGFMPARAEDKAEQALLKNMPVFMAAGERDERIPLELSRSSAEVVRALGAFLEYREYNTGHKLNAEGMRKLRSWWADRENYLEIHRDT